MSLHTEPPSPTCARPLRLALVGGGPGSGIGETHRIAARIDGLYEIVAGVFSSDARRSADFAASLGIGPDRAYRDWADMLEREADRADGATVLAVMTPNASHHAICMKALDLGFDVICDKPLTTSLATSVEVWRRSLESGRIVGVTYCYTGYPMVRQARAMVRAGLLGTIRQVHVQYVQGWAADPALAGWRLDPAAAGETFTLGDIGIHAFHLASFVTGLRASAVMADLGPTVPGRHADDYAGLLLAYENGARGNMWVTSAAAGSEHGLLFRVFGDEGGLEWHQETPNALIHMPRQGFSRTITRRLSDDVVPQARQASRIARGLPEGYLEAFATIYSDVARAIAGREAGDLGAAADLPTARDGCESLRFVEAATASSSSGRWMPIEPVEATPGR